jgi:hypothetical protein
VMLVNGVLGKPSYWLRNTKLRVGAIPNEEAPAVVKGMV